MRKTVVIIGTLDTKGQEIKYIKEQMQKKGMDVVVIDSSMRGGAACFEPDISREIVAEAAGSSIESVEKQDRGKAEEVMMRGLARTVKELYVSGRLDGVISVGGSDGAILARAGMEVLPIGVPKLIVSPIFQGKERFEEYVGNRDITLMHSAADLFGVNVLTKKILDNAIGAIVGMVDAEVEVEISGDNLIAASVYDNDVFLRCKLILEKKNYEVIAFHANSTGCRIMEELVEQGIFKGILDLTLHGITDALFSGLHPAETSRLEAAGKKGIPQLVCPGSLGFIIKGPLQELSPKYNKRKLYFFNPAVTLVRTTKEEMKMVGKVIAEKLNKAVGPVAVAIPLRGDSYYNKRGKALYDPEADEAFLKMLKRKLNLNVRIFEVDSHINDSIFAEKCASILIAMLEGKTV